MTSVSKEIPLNSFTVSIESVKKIYRGLQKAVKEEADLRLANLKMTADQGPEDFEAQKEEVKDEAFQVTVSVYREDGSHTYGTSEDIFELSGSMFPVTKIYMTNTTAFRGYTKLEPANSFQVMFDFAQPPLLDANNLVSRPTLNSSNLTIRGDRDSWMAGIEKIVLSHIDIRHKLRSAFHGPFVYDYGLLMVGIPFSLYACWLFSGYVNNVFGALPTILSAAAYIYIGFAALWCYRILFGYTKWAFPLVELKEQRNRPKIHRRFWWGLVTLLFLKVFWDFFDPYLSISRWFHLGA